MSDVREPQNRTAEPTLDAGKPVGRSLVFRTLRPLLKRPTADASLPVAPASYLDTGTVEVKPRRKPRTVLISFAICVLLPALLSGIYFFGIAADQYAAEARFAVKTVAFGNEGDNSVPGGSLVSQDAEIVADYIKSRAIVDDIESKFDLRAIFQRPEADPFAKLPAHASIEDLTDYWKRMVSVYIESSSGIVTVETRAFRRDDALKLTQAIVNSSETLVNSLSNNIRMDVVKHAEDEVRRSESEVRLALAALTSFRNAQGLIDPVKSAEQSGKLLLQLMGDKIQTEGQLFVSQRTTSPNAPGAAAVRAKLESLDAQIAKLQQQLAGAKSTKGNLAASISSFEELELKLQFAEKMFSFATDGLDRARMTAERQAVYLAVFVPPTLPEDYAYPLRGADFMLLVMGALMAWACGSTIWASILDHRL